MNIIFEQKMTLFLFFIFLVVDAYAFEDNWEEPNQKIRIYSEIFGDKKNPVIVLNGDIQDQMIVWDQDKFCKKLVERNYCVVIHDYRDMGKSQDDPRSKLKDLGPFTYTMMDLTKDVINLLDEHGIQRATLVGLGMGGMLAQLGAAKYPNRVSNLIIIGSTQDFRPFLGITSLNHLPDPQQYYLDWKLANENLEKQIERETLEERVSNYVSRMRILNGSKKGFDEVYFKNQAKKYYERQGSEPLTNHEGAMLNSLKEFEEALPNINQHTLVIYGDDDPVFPPPHAEYLANKLNAKLIKLNNFAHVLTPNHFGQLVNLIDKFMKENKPSIVSKK